MTSSKSDRWLKAMALVAVVFGLLTIGTGGSTLFGGEAARKAAGDYVPFVLWFNFLAGFAYVIAGGGLWQARRWGLGLAMLIAAATLLVFAAFGVHVARGGTYELRTVAAMSIRSAVWIIIAWQAARRIPRRP